jgi:hypothetical protein
MCDSRLFDAAAGVFSVADKVIGRLGFHGMHMDMSTGGSLVSDMAGADYGCRRLTLVTQTNSIELSELCSSIKYARKLLGA